MFLSVIFPEFFYVCIDFLKTEHKIQVLFITEKGRRSQLTNEFIGFVIKFGL